MGPNHTTQERLLFLYGLYTQGTEAAAEYVTNAERLAELHKALLALSPDRKTLRLSLRYSYPSPWRITFLGALL